MIPLSALFKAILKGMNTIKFQIHVLYQLFLKIMARTVLFPNDFPVNTLTHLWSNDFNVRAYCRLGWENHKSRKLMSFILYPKPRKFKIKQ